MDRRTLALRSLRNLCAFIGGIALFSYFSNWAVDLRHWYVTLGSAFACSILWLGFYVIEMRGGARLVALKLSRLGTKSPELEEVPQATESTITTTDLPTAPASTPMAHTPDTQVEVEAGTPNALPWLKPVPPLKKAAGKP